MIDFSQLQDAPWTQTPIGGTEPTGNYNYIPLDYEDQLASYNRAQEPPGKDDPMSWSTGQTGTSADWRTWYKPTLHPENVMLKTPKQQGNSRAYLISEALGDEQAREESGLIVGKVGRPSKDDKSLHPENVTPSRPKQRGR